ncbi:MAG TPA: hypothetical protein VI488_19760 [Candidatus Angelobacter sp.]
MQAEVDGLTRADAHPASMQLTATLSAAPKLETNAQVGRNFSLTQTLDRNLAPCPQGSDCAGGSEPIRLFDCELGCGFRGCGACMELHENEPHVSDTDTMLAMVRDLGGAW